MAGPTPHSGKSPTNPKWFRCLLGRKARLQLQENGGAPATFRLMLAASGGPRWLGLVGIDRALRGFLSLPDRSQPLPLLGASSGAWRMAAISSDEGGETYQRLIEEYIHQRFEGKPTPAEVSQVCRDYLGRLFSPERIAHALRNSHFQLNFTTALLPSERPGKARTVGAMVAAVLLNLVDRRLLGWTMKRALFSVLPHPPNSPLSEPWDALPRIQVGLNQDNFLPGILATGSIPTVLEGESSIPGSAPGHHLDGGLVDYHFEIESGGPILYPHFSDDPIPGWMDRFPPYRRISRKAREELCIVLPSRALLEKFPTGDFPCRQDFRRYDNDRRIKLWTETVELNSLLEDELRLCLECGDLAAVAEDFT